MRWRDDSDGLPPALDGEGAFAASGTCLVTRGRSHAWIVSGAAAGGRAYHTADRGRSWSAVTVPMVAGQASGPASIAMRDERNGLAMGGKLADANDLSPNVARTRDAGGSWTAATRTSFTGAVFGSAYVPRTGATIFAVGPKGLAWSANDGEAWTTLSEQAYWAVGFASSSAGWAVGPGGRITRISLPR